MKLLVSIHGEGMGISSLLVMITLGLEMYIGDLMPWIHSLNLRGHRITYWVYILSHFRLDQGDMSNKFDFFHFFLVICTKVSIVKWRGGKKISNLDEHSEVVGRFLIFS